MSAVKKQAAPETPGAELARLGREIARLDDQLAQIDTNQATLEDTITAAQSALNQALRQYGADGSQAMLERVQESEERLQSARTRAATSGNSKSVLLGDRAASQRRHDEIAAELGAQAKTIALQRLRGQLAGLRSDIEDQLVEYVALRHVCEGSPVGSAALKEFVTRDLRAAAEARVKDIASEWKNGNA